MAISLFGALEPVIETLKNYRGVGPFGLTSGKLSLERVRNIEVEDGVISFELVRHHPIGGAIYTAGCAMSAFISQRYRYEYFPESEEFEQKPVGDPTWDETEWDWYSLAEDQFFDSHFFFVETEPGLFLMTENCSNFNDYVKNVDEAIEHGRKMIGSWNFAELFIELDEKLRSPLCERLRSICQENVTEIINAAWDDRELL